IPDRLTTCGIISGLGPMDLEVEEEIKSIRRLFFVIRRMPWLFKLMIFFQSRGLKILDCSLSIYPPINITWNF
ncbi:unnamed protein product, partial [marine sediment metagenome]